MTGMRSRRWMGLGRFFWIGAVVSLCAMPCLAVDVLVGETLDLDYAINSDWLQVYGTANLLPSDAYVDWGITVFSGGVLNVRAGSIGAGFSVTVNSGASATVYGMGFADSSGPVAAGSWTPPGGSDTLTGTYENGSSISLSFTSDIPITLAAPSVTNLPPVAMAGEEGLIGPGGKIHPIESSAQSTTVVLGQASDPESEPIEYRWLEGATVLLDWTAVTTVPEAYLDLSTLATFSGGDHVLTLEVRETTGDLLESSDTMTLRILSAPEITEITIEPAALGSPTTATAVFADADGGTHTAMIVWEEGGTAEAGIVNETEMTVTGSHTYAETGVYTVTVTVVDQNGGTSSITAYAAVYDPSAVSFAAGGGSIADAGSPWGRARFGFFIRQWGCWGPAGRLRFRWDDKCFQSTEIDYLIVSEDQSSAWFSGVGMVNGAGEYYFMAEVSDGPDGIDLVIFDQYETAGLVDLLRGRIRIRQWN